MQILDTISNDAKQKHTVLLESDNSPIVIRLTYRPTQIGWFLDLEYETKNFKANGIRITTNTNILNQWRNILPFGLICYCDGNQDPLSIQDFLVERAHLAVLSADEVKEINKLQQDYKDE